MRISIVSGDGTITYSEDINQVQTSTENFSSTLDTATQNLTNSTAAQSVGNQPQVAGATGQVQNGSGQRTLEDIFQEAASTYNVDVNLLKAIAKQESNFRTDATSSSGAQGIMQLMPATAQGLGVEDAYDPYQNIMGGAKLISKLLNQYNGDVSLALAAYNAGSGNVAKYGGIPPFQETQNYVVKVQEYYAQVVDVPDETVSVAMTKQQSANELLSLLSEFPNHSSYSLFVSQMQALQNQQSSGENTEEQGSTDSQIAYRQLLQNANQAILNTISNME